MCTTKRSSAAKNETRALPVERCQGSQRPNDVVVLLYQSRMRQPVELLHFRKQLRREITVQ